MPPLDLVETLHCEIRVALKEPVLRDKLSAAPADRREIVIAEHFARRGVAARVVTVIRAPRSGDKYLLTWQPLKGGRVERLWFTP